MNRRLPTIAEVDARIAKSKDACASLDRGESVALKGRVRTVFLGPPFPTKVNTNIGVADEAQHESIRHLLCTLSQLPYKPDTLMDHTIVNLAQPLWKSMVSEFDGPVGALPHYLAYRERSGIDEADFMERVHEMAEYGIAFMTLHLTPSRKLYDIAMSCRHNPTTARGGGIVLRDMLRNKREVNVVEKNLDSILRICRDKKVTISVGSTFRPSCIREALDKVHLEETRIQGDLVKRIRNNGVKVMMEGIGHAKLTVLPKYSRLVKRVRVPFMPLGPVPTDSAIGFDHISGAIGASHMALLGTASIINSLTREEHTGGVPKHDSIIEGLMVARVVAHSVNVTRFPEIEGIDHAVSAIRERNRSCVASGGLFGLSVRTSVNGCGRCKFECPLRVAS